jgi:diguanylate cyclase (GGDEF)-like protein/PAS domain S-box-containing protein
MSEFEKNPDEIGMYLSTMFNNAQDFIFVKDADCRLVLVNEAYCRLFSVSKSEVIGKTLAWNLTPIEEERFLAADRQLLADGQEVVFEETVAFSGSQTKTIAIRKNRYLDAQGNYFLVGIGRDITDRKETELRENSRNAVLELIARGEELPVILDAIVSAVEKQNPDMLCSILLLDDAGKHLLSGTAASLPDFYNEAIHGIKIGLEVGSCGTAAFLNERVIVENIQTHPYWATYRELANKAELGACWSEPIRSTKGEVLGTFAIYHHNPNEPKDVDIAVIEKTAYLASIAIEQEQSHLALKSYESRFHQLLQSIPSVAVQSYDEKGETRYWNKASEELYGYSAEEAIGQNLFDLIIPKALHTNVREAMLEMFETRHVIPSSELTLTAKDGSDVNVFSSHAFVQVPGQPAEMFCLDVDLTERKQAEEKLERIAHYDLLTNLPNRVLLAERLSLAMVQSDRSNRFVAVAFMDLDGFKAVNDSYGHNVGDELLVILSKRMKDALREGGTLARIGGDEFIAVMVDIVKEEDYIPVLTRLLKAAEEPVNINGVVFQVSASIGVTLYPQDNANAEQLIRHADQAMYIAKQAGKNRYHVFDPVHDNAIMTQWQGIDEIRSALDRREFVLHYQPKVNMFTGEVIGVEALIRWQHSELGLLPPSEFLPVIEGQKISLELGEWVIDTALSQIGQWKNIGVHLPISVNISAYQLQQDDFTERLESLLSEHPKVSPYCLELEVLETSALNDINQISATMKECQTLDVRFALDDFGTGYSSLTHLRHLPAHLVKIDLSFVQGMLVNRDDLAIVEGVIGLARAFQREVIAEGVETTAHGVALLQLGCQLAQGYGIARPMPAKDIPNWVSTWKADDAWQIETNT